MFTQLVVAWAENLLNSIDTVALSAVKVKQQQQLTNYKSCLIKVCFSFQQKNGAD